MLKYLENLLSSRNVIVLELNNGHKGISR